MSSQKKNSLYNPRPESVDVDFIVHHKTYDRLWEELSTSKMEFPEQHYLISGEQGSGKTTLLAQLNRSVMLEPPIPSLQSLFFNEEEYSIRHLYRFWERIFELLNDQGLMANTISNEIQSVSEEIDKNQDYEKKISNQLLNWLESNEIHLLLFIDNFNLILKKLSTPECHRFRKILQTSSRIRIMAAAPEVPASFYQYEHPFYEFFKVVYLRPLSLEQTQSLVLQLLPKPLEDTVTMMVSSIEAIRRITNGNTRCTVILAGILKENISLTVQELFFDILDKLTPTYKFTMDDLPAQQQQIIEAIALNYEAISVKELGNKLRMESKIISAQLGQLVKSNLVVKIKTSTKNNFYHLKNRLFNCWYILRLGRNKDRKKLIELINFIENWIQKNSQFQKNIFQEIPLISIDKVPQFAKHKKNGLSTNSRLISERSSLRSTPTINYQLRQRAYQALDSKQYKLAIQFLNKTKEKDHFALAIAYHQGTNDYKRAITHYKKAANIGQGDAFNNLGLIHLHQNHNQKEAYRAFTRAVEKGSHIAHYNLGLYHLEQEKDLVAAIDHFEKAVSYGNSSASLALAQLYFHQFKKPNQAIMILSEAAANGNPKANYQLGLIYLNHEKDIDSALHYFQKYLISPSTKTLSLPLGLTLLKHEAYSFLQNLFESKPEIKTTALPLYYALQKCDINAIKDEVLKMGWELETTVREIVELIENN